MGPSSSRSGTGIQGDIPLMLELCLGRLHDSIMEIEEKLSRHDKDEWNPDEWSSKSRTRFLGSGMRYMLVRDGLKESMNK